MWEETGPQVGDRERRASPRQVCSLTCQLLPGLLGKLNKYLKPHISRDVCILIGIKLVSYSWMCSVDGQVSQVRWEPDGLLKLYIWFKSDMFNY